MPAPKADITSVMSPGSSNPEAFVKNQSAR